MQSVDSNEDDYDDDYDEDTDESRPELEKRNFDIYDPVEARPLDEVTLETYNNVENTFGQPQYGHESQDPPYTYNAPTHYINHYSNTPSSYEYNHTLYNMTFSPDSDRSSYESELHPQGSSDTEIYDTRDYYSQASPESSFDQKQYYESAYNYSLSQNQNPYPEEPPRNPEQTHYSNIPDSSYGYNYGSSSSQERDTNERSINQSQFYGSSESERPEDDPRYRQSQDYSTYGNQGYDYSQSTNQTQYYGSSEVVRPENDPRYSQDYGSDSRRDDHSRYTNQSQYYGSSESERPNEDPRYRQYQDYSTASRQEESRQSGYDYPRSHYYGSTAQESERTQESSYNYGSNSQESGSQTQYSNDYNYNYTQDRDQSTDNRYNYTQDRDRDNDDKRIETSHGGSTFEARPEERVDDRSQYYDPRQRQIDENDQEVTFDDTRRIEADYYERERSPSVQVIDSITPDSRQVDSDPYGRETLRNYDNRLVYQPNSSSDYYAKQSQTDSDNYGKSQDTTTNSYHNRMNQVDEYWREEERRKKMYESQNIYRRDSGSERLDSWTECTFDSMGRPINCPAGSPGSWSNNEDPISMQAPPQPIPPVYPPPVNEFTSNSAGDKESAEAEAERIAFQKANRVQLSVPHWPTRDMDRLGFYPRHPACRLPPKWGVGPEERSAWFYSFTDGRCLWFSYAGHGGNANRFYSRANCESLCVFDHSDLCQNAKCGYLGSRCMLRGDERCKEYAKSRGKDLEIECPPDQPVCRARRAIIPPEYDTSMVPRECKEGVDAGGCLVKNPLIRYYYDERSNTCRAFYFHGCGGNNNRFESMQECMNHCAL
ncbi:unnamed protein product [Hymenolepis diminuta]|nr:unnamed protein product [Hymenolepis diminuta]